MATEDELLEMLTESARGGNVAAMKELRAYHRERRGERPGVNVKALSTYMGHANIRITLDQYGHLLPGAEDEAAGLLDAFLVRQAGGAELDALFRERAIGRTSSQPS